LWDAVREGVTPANIGKLSGAGERYGLLMNALTELGGSPAGSEGGFLNPVDFDGIIHEMQRLAVDLAPDCNVEEVTAYSGWRSFETAAAALPFAEIVESNFPSGERIAEMESPTFTKVEYALKDYGGYLPVANNLFQDSPANIMQYLARWCGRKVSLTNSSLVLAIVNALTPVNVTDWTTVDAAIKTALNKSIDPAISASAKVYCNQSGFDLLDQLLDGNGRPILSPDPTNATLKRFLGREVKVLSDAQWPLLTSSTYARIGVGDMRELVTFFRRSSGELASTTVGGTAWRNNNTEIRYIMRADVAQVDSGAMKLLKVTMP
jgi:HK97 family phage major capsid protein